MKITVRYFASIREAIGQHGIRLAQYLVVRHAHRLAVGEAGGIGAAARNQQLAQLAQGGGGRHHQLRLGANGFAD